MKEIIARLRELEKLATPGEWYTDGYGKVGADSVGGGIGEMDEERDGRLAAFTRNNLIDLLDYVERLEKVREAAKPYMEQFDDSRLAKVIKEATDGE